MLPKRIGSLFTMLALAACSGPGVNYRWTEQSVTHAWRPSFVVLFGRDLTAPAHAPSDCKRLAVVEFFRHGDKAYHLAGLLRAAQNVGGNGVTEIAVKSRRGRKFHYEAIIVSCSESLFAIAPGQAIDALPSRPKTNKANHAPYLARLKSCHSCRNFVLQLRGFCPCMIWNACGSPRTTHNACDAEASAFFARIHRFEPCGAVSATGETLRRMSSRLTKV